MDPLVPAKFHAPVIELNVHPSDEGIKAEGASAVATIDANVNTVRGEEPRSPESAAAAAAAAATTTTTTTTTAQNGTQNTTAIATNGAPWLLRSAVCSVWLCTNQHQKPLPMGPGRGK